MSRYLLAFALLSSVLALRAQDAPALIGRVNGRTYVSPTGVFKVTIPVLPELGGAVTDTPNVVTFQDSFNVHVSIAAFPQDATQRWEMATRGKKDYLDYFFANFVLSDFKRSFRGVTVEDSKFRPDTMGGALITYILIPGGSMFTDHMPPVTNGAVPVAKRGNMLFVKNGYIFVISTELAERVIEGSAYKKTPKEEDAILDQKLSDVLDKMDFLKVSTKSDSGPSVPSPLSAPTRTR
ncbi:MAG TPA: hypothetical protein VHE61_13890 [Opitutaceae bacterium]|nr:hypothetical protein [Opitutaceae bacterium]